MIKNGKYVQEEEDNKWYENYVKSVAEACIEKFGFDAVERFGVLHAERLLNNIKIEIVSI